MNQAIQWNLSEGGISGGTTNYWGLNSLDIFLLCSLKTLDKIRIMN